MVDKLMYIPNEIPKITPAVNYNLWLKRFDTQLNEPTYQNSIKVLRFIKSTLGTSVINSPMSPPFLIIDTYPKLTKKLTVIKALLSSTNLEWAFATLGCFSGNNNIDFFLNCFFNS